MKNKNKNKKLLKLWKARQRADGYDVSGVVSLREAEHFFDIPAEAEETAEAKEDAEAGTTDPDETADTTAEE